MRKVLQSFGIILSLALTCFASFAQDVQPSDQSNNQHLIEQKLNELALSYQCLSGSNSRLPIMHFKTDSIESLDMEGPSLEFGVQSGALIEMSVGKSFFNDLVVFSKSLNEDGSFNYTVSTLYCSYHPLLNNQREVLNASLEGQTVLTPPSNDCAVGSVSHAKLVLNVAAFQMFLPSFVETTFGPLSNSASPDASCNIHTQIPDLGISNGRREFGNGNIRPFIGKVGDGYGFGFSLRM